VEYIVKGIIYLDTVRRIINYDYLSAKEKLNWLCSITWSVAFIFKGCTLRAYASTTVIIIMLVAKIASG